MGKRVLAGRLHAGIFEALAGSNRAAGSGGGSGLRPGAISGLTTSAGYVAGVTNAGWTTIASANILLPHPGDVLVWANINWQRTAGTIGDTFFAEIQADSDADWITGFGLVDGGNYLENAPNDTFARAGFMLKGYLFQPGKHTLNLKATVTGDTFQCQGTITVASTF